MSMYLSEAIRRLDAVADMDPLYGVKEDVAEGGKRLIDNGFLSSTDPYGNAWAPLKRPEGTRAGGPLRKTDVMRQSTDGQPSAEGVTFTVDGPANFHQDGTVRIPIRRMLPVESMGLPRAWNVMISDSFARRMIAQIVGR